MGSRKPACPSFHPFIQATRPHYDGGVLERDARESKQASIRTCLRQEASGDTIRVSGEFVIRMDFLLYILRIPVAGYLLSGTSTGTG